MNYKETLEAVELSLLSRAVPLIIGESGIGKTSLIKDFAKRNDMYLVNIDANLLKEGENRRSAHGGRRKDLLCDPS